jgi:diguanylate cyclase (GGDEF)-like protein
MRRAREALRPRRSDYAGADVRQARRITALLSFLGGITAVVTLPLSPPTVAFGASGWLLAGGVVLAFLAGGVWMRSGNSGFGLQLLASYFGLALVAVLEWLAGGWASSYNQLYFLPVVAVAGVQPKRQVALFLAALTAVALLPLGYVGVSAAGAATIGSRIVFWVGMTVAILLLMSRIREQRVGLFRRGEAAKELARVDALTGLGNRRAFDEALEREVARSQRTGTPLTVGVADLDGFKHINDAFGHVKGDECLRQAAEALAEEVRRPDTCFRWGGDEFALILPDTDRAGAELLAERLSAAVSGSCVTPDGSSFGVTTGFSELSGDGTPNGLLDEADRELMVRKGRPHRGQEVER